MKIKKKYLIFREDAKKLSIAIQNEAKKDKTKTISFDFSDTAFLSRSFIDEFLNVIDNLKKKKIIIKIVDLKPQLKKFLEQVEKKKKALKRI